MQRSWQLLAKGNSRLNKKRPDRTKKRQTNARKWKARGVSRVFLCESRKWQGKRTNCHKETKTLCAPPMTSIKKLRDSRAARSVFTREMAVGEQCADTDHSFVQKVIDQLQQWQTQQLSHRRRAPSVPEIKSRPRTRPGKSTMRPTTMPTVSMRHSRSA